MQIVLKTGHALTVEHYDRASSWLEMKSVLELWKKKMLCDDKYTFLDWMPEGSNSFHVAIVRDAYFNKLTVLWLSNVVLNPLSNWLNHLLDPVEAITQSFFREQELQQKLIQEGIENMEWTPKEFNW